MARKTGSHSKDTGPKVRDAALRLIAQHGFAAVSMRQIAQEVGVQAGALYNYTADKQSLLFDLMRTHMEDLLADRAALPQAADPLARLDAFTRFHIRWHLTREDQVFVSYMELRNLTPENFARIEVLRKVYEDALEAILADGMQAGQLRILDSKITTLAIIAMLTGMSTWYREGGRLPLAEIEAIYVDMVRRLAGA